MRAALHSFLPVGIDRYATAPPCLISTSHYLAFCLSVVAVDEHVAGSPLRTPEDDGGSDFTEEAKRSMGLLRLGRSRWSGPESSKRSMGLLRLGRSDSDGSNVEDDKRSMQLLRLGRKRNNVDNYDDVDSQQLNMQQR